MRRMRDLARALSLLAAGSPVPALAQKLGGASEPEISFVRILGALVLCIGAAVAMALLISKRGLPGKSWGEGIRAKLRSRSRIMVIEARRISPHADVCLIRCDGKEYLLICGPGDIRVLSEAEASADELTNLPGSA